MTTKSQQKTRLVDTATRYVRTAQKRYVTKGQILEALGYDFRAKVVADGLRLTIEDELEMYVGFEVAGLTLEYNSQKVAIVKYIPQECERIPYLVVYPDTAPAFSDKQLLFLSRHPQSTVIRVPNEDALRHLLTHLAVLIAPN